MSDGINISLAEVSATAASIRSTNSNLANTLQQIKTQMNNLQNSWQSDAGNTIRERMNAMQPRFEQYREVVESYSKFLDQTVTAYNATESNVNSAASSFK